MKNILHDFRNIIQKEKTKKETIYKIYLLIQLNLNQITLIESGQTLAICNKHLNHLQT